ncbi:MAG: FHA domain-containing protein [Isosphaeraceae bacterium]
MGREQSIVPTLQILSGPLAGRLFKVDRDLIIIGRNPDCDLVLEPKSVSRKHAAIVREGREHVIKDLGSTRGTVINGNRLSEPVVLTSGSVLQLGEVLAQDGMALVQDAIQDGLADAQITWWA